MTLVAGVILGGAVTLMLLMAIGFHMVASQQLQMSPPQSFSRSAQAFGPR